MSAIQRCKLFRGDRYWRFHRIYIIRFDISNFIFVLSEFSTVFFFTPFVVVSRLFVYYSQTFFFFFLTKFSSVRTTRTDPKSYTRVARVLGRVENRVSPCNTCTGVTAHLPYLCTKTKKPTVGFRV